MEAGLYFVWENSELVYVGESGNTKNRMSNLKNTPNHTLRRKIGISLGFILNSNKKFSATEETQLNQYCQNHCTMAFVTIPVGRREIEENYIFTYKPKYNQPSTRGRKRGEKGQNNIRLLICSYLSPILINCYLNPVSYERIIYLISPLYRHVSGAIFHTLFSKNFDDFLNITTYKEPSKIRREYLKSVRLILVCMVNAEFN